MRAGPVAALSSQLRGRPLRDGRCSSTGLACCSHCCRLACLQLKQAQTKGAGWLGSQAQDSPWLSTQMDSAQPAHLGEEQHAVALLQQQGPWSASNASGQPACNAGLGGAAPQRCFLSSLPLGLGNPAAASRAAAAAFSLRSIASQHSPAHSTGGSCPAPTLRSRMGTQGQFQ